MQYKAFHKLSYGLYVISTESDGEKAGYIGNTVFQVTSEPARVAISCHKDNYTAKKILRSKKFSISVLEKECDTSLIGEFGFMSGAEVDKFKNIETITAVTGAPIVLNFTVAWFDCEVVNEIDVGTHILVVGKVVDCEVISEVEPLTYDYYRKKYKMLAPKNAPTYIDKDKLGKESGEEPEIKEKPVEEKEPESGTYTCSICGFQYNPEEGDPTMGIAAGTPFGELPDDYKCPICNAGREYFNKD